MPDPQPRLRYALILMSGVSTLIPLAGLVTAPILARALSASGRGELAAALAPAGLMLAAATLGLPDALTFYIAKQPEVARAMVIRAVGATLALGIACFVATWLCLPLLSAGSVDLGSLILLSSASTIPALFVNVLRGAAVGKQMWKHAALERVFIVFCRVVGFGLLFALGQLTVFTALLVNLIPPVIAGFVYLSTLKSDPKHELIRPDRITFVEVTSYGSRVWLGSVASMTLSRITPLLMVPLASSRDLGLYTVAATVSDLPLVIALGIQGALFGVNSRENDADKLAEASRLTVLFTLTGCILLGLSLPFWLVPLFGPSFQDATLPALILLAAAVITTPGLAASTALSAWGRPGLRSVGLGLALAVTLGLFIWLVPLSGVLGACVTALCGSITLTSFNMVMAAPLSGLRVRDFYLVRRPDFARIVRELRRVCSVINPAVIRVTRPLRRRR